MSLKENKGDIDLSGALNPPDSGNRLPAKQPVADMILRPETPALIRWLNTHSGGLIKNEKQASFIVLGLAILAIAISIFLFIGGNEERGVMPVDRYINQKQFLPSQ